MNTCTLESHAALRADPHLFFEKTEMLPLVPFAVDGFIYRNCIECHSTLALPECAGCGCACPTGDAVETRQGTFHVRCLLLRAVERGRFTVVAHVKVGKAAEFARVMP